MSKDHIKLQLSVLYNCWFGQSITCIHHYWRTKQQLTPVFLPGKSHGQRSLAGCNPWGSKELDTGEHTCMHASIITVSCRNSSIILKFCCAPSIHPLPQLQSLIFSHSFALSRIYIVGII